MLVKQNNRKKFLYIITKNEEINESFLDDLQLILKDFSNYIYAVQIRIKNKLQAEKSIIKIKEICNTHAVPLIINDFLDLAEKYDLDGIHIGQDDINIKDVKECFGLKNKIIGVSCYNNIERAKLMSEDGATYVSFGCFYKSATKPNPKAFADKSAIELWKRLNKDIINKNITTVVIGGINETNFIPLMQSGADVVAISGCIWNSSEPYIIIQRMQQAYENCIL